MTRRSSRSVESILEDRVQVHATLVASQPPLDALHAAIADPTLADAILNRLVHHAHKLILKGESLRKALAGGVSKNQRQGGEALPRRR